MVESDITAGLRESANLWDSFIRASVAYGLIRRAYQISDVSFPYVDEFTDIFTKMGQFLPKTPTRIDISQANKITLYDYMFSKFLKLLIGADGHLRQVSGRGTLETIANSIPLSFT
ncbi:hypothetical protein HYY70_00395 [Candidatus Woesearchaeota archaeon]|nr:hypothetical protein [Candidatus Woesearchaeota archaeon]